MQLYPYAAELTEQLQAILRDEKAEVKRRFRAALALADYIPETEATSWTAQDLQFVARQLVVENAEFQPLLRENLRPISERLLPDLATIFGDPTATDAQRLSAANAFADYAASDIAKLSELLTVATPEQYAVLYPIVAASPSPPIVEDLGKIAATLPPEDMGPIERVPYGQRRANAAVTLLRLGEREKALPVFEMTDDPEALTQFIFRCRDLDVRVEELLECLRIVSDGPIDRYPRNTRYALLLALGEYALAEFPESQQALLLTQLGDWYRNDPSSGVHGATGWLLRKWGQAEIVRAVDQTPVPYSENREWFTLAITVTPTSPPKPTEKAADENADAEAETSTGWFAQNSGQHVHPPKELRPSRRGLFDLDGNVFEFCNDVHDDYKTESVSDPSGPNAGSFRVFRGGSWFFNSVLCRTAARNSGIPTLRSSYGGIRLALSLLTESPDANESR